MTAGRALPIAASLALLAGCGGGASSPRTAAAPPPCFAAAARDPQHPCTSPRLALVVSPTPAVAARTPNAPCTRVARDDLVSVCAFGAPSKAATRTIALMGDSHAAMWRAGIAVVAGAKRWHGLSVMRTGCPASTATRQLFGPATAQCARWQHEIVPWLRQHPEVSVVFVTALGVGPFLHPPSETNTAAAIAGYQRLWRAMPPSVRHIVVIRDTPLLGRPNLPCVRRAIAAHRSAARACAVARDVALTPDPEVTAARRMHSSRVQVVDVSDFMCDRRRCFPVVGGALVLKDLHHLTRLFAASLGPYVLRQVSALSRTWRE